MKTADLDPLTPIAHIATDQTVRTTTLKLPPNVGAGLRLAAAVDKSTVSELAEHAVRLILEKYDVASKELPQKLRKGRPGPTLKSAARAIVQHPQTRNDTIPTRIEVTTAQALEDLARSLKVRNNQIAEEGALAYIQSRGPDIARDIAGLTSKVRQEKAHELLRQFVRGEVSIRVSKATSRHKSELVVTPRRSRTSKAADAA